MRSTMIILLALPLALTACGEAKKSFDEGVEKSFHKEFVDSCVTSAVKTGAPPAAASKLCGCTADKLKQKYSGSELLSVSEAEMQVAAQACLKEYGAAPQ